MTLAWISAGFVNAESVKRMYVARDEIAVVVALHGDAVFQGGPPVGLSWAVAGPGGGYLR